MSLVDKIRKARESRVEAGGFTFIIRRPTELEIHELVGKPIRALLPFVVGWEGVRELDIIAGGNPHPLEFDAEACAAWLEDRIDLVAPLSKAIHDSYSTHAEKRETERKN